jgi:hypothetical protein
MPVTPGPRIRNALYALIHISVVRKSVRRNLCATPRGELLAMLTT